jgi:hypothetical protein
VRSARLPAGFAYAAFTCGALLCAGLLSSIAARAQDQPFNPPPLAPVPVPLLNAKKVFVSNAGADSGLFPHPFSGDPDRPYNEFYAGVKSWGRYEQVDDPADADIVFELHLSAPSGPQSPNKQNGASDPLPMFRLTILDRRTHYVLWALTESVGFAYLQKTHDHNFDLALTAIIDDLKRLTSAPAPATASVKQPSTATPAPSRQDESAGAGCAPASSTCGSR